MNIIVNTDEAIDALERLNVLPHRQRRIVLEEANRICDTLAPRPHIATAIARALANLAEAEATVMRALRDQADQSTSTYNKENT